jgi:hypothetical protein
MPGGKASKRNRRELMAIQNLPPDLPKQAQYQSWANYTAARFPILKCWNGTKTPILRFLNVS